MGRLEIRYLNADLPPYDPERNFDRVRNKGWTPIDPVVWALDGVGKPVTGPAQETTSAPVDSGTPGPRLGRTQALRTRKRRNSKG